MQINAKTVANAHQLWNCLLLNCWWGSFGCEKCGKKWVEVLPALFCSESKRIAEYYTSFKAGSVYEKWAVQTAFFSGCSERAKWSCSLQVSQLSSLIIMVDMSKAYTEGLEKNNLFQNEFCCFRNWNGIQTLIQLYSVTYTIQMKDMTATVR